MTSKRLHGAAKALIDAVSFDVNGIALPVGFQGGNGGLVSRETIAAADALRRALQADATVMEALAAAHQDAAHTGLGVVAVDPAGRATRLDPETYKETTGRAVGELVDGLEPQE